MNLVTTYWREISMRFLFPMRSNNFSKRTHWDLEPGPSACEADVIQLHHAPVRVISSASFVLHIVEQSRVRAEHPNQLDYSGALLRFACWPTASNNTCGGSYVRICVSFGAAAFQDHINNRIEKFHHRDSNPGRSCEGRVPEPARL